MTSEQWQQLLRQLQDAEDAGKEGEARVLRSEALAHRLQRRAENPAAPVTALDLMLLLRLGNDLERQGLHEEALGAYGSAREHAIRQQNDYFRIFFELTGVRSCLALLDSHAATAVLTRVLGTAPDSVSDALQVATRLTLPGATPLQEQALRVQALHALGSLYGFRGRLGGADRTLASALEIAGDQLLFGLSTPEIAIQLAEVRLDRGDFGGFDVLRASWATADTAHELRVKWRILQGTSLHLRGRLSEAERLFREVTDRPQPLSLARYLDSARWQRANVLAALNRLEEAEALLPQLHASPERYDPTQLKALLEARRSPTFALAMPPTPKEARARGLAQVSHELPPQPSRPDAPFVLEPLRRTTARVRDDWARLSNNIQLALHHGHIEQAREQFTAVAEWAATFDAPLLKARYHHLAALVAYYGGEYAAAERHGLQAADLYASLGMPTDELSACHVQRWARQRTSPGDTDLSAIVFRNQAILERIKEGLEGHDRILGLLNKWSVVDEVISDGCRRLHVRAEQLPASRWSRWLANRRLKRETYGTLLGAHEKKRWPDVTGAAEPGPTPGGQGGSTLDIGPWALHRARRDASPGIELSQLSFRWLPADTALLFYVSLPERLELFLAHRKGCELVRLPAPSSRALLWERVEKALHRLRFADVWREDRVPASLVELSERLGIPEVARRLPAKVTRLCIVPDDILVHVPFAALPLDRQPLIQRYSVSFLPSARWTRRSSALPRKLRSAVGVGVTRTSVGPFDALARAVEEIQVLKGLPLTRLVALEDEHARREAVMQALPEAELAHFACHGEFHREVPHRSGLALHEDWLTLEDLQQLNMERLRLVVLGACWGASTAVLPGREMVSLPVTFLRRGAESVIAALWKVGDAASLELARALYAGLGKADPVEALARVQREWCRERRPEQWAPYVAYSQGVAAPLAARCALWLKERLRKGPSRSAASSAGPGHTPRAPAPASAGTAPTSPPGP